MKHLLITSALTVFAATVVSAETIRATSSFGPNHVLATHGYPALFEKLSEFTDGRWTGNDTPSGLLAPNEMNTGLRDGVSDMGPIIMPYFAADYPESGLVGEMSMLGSDNRAISSAVTEYIATCDACIAEFAANGQIFLGTDATTNYQFLSTVDIHSLDDLAGLRIRTAGSVFTRFVEGMGAEAVQMPSSELFEALNSGVIDATYSSVGDLKNAQLYDVVTSVTLVDKGVFNAAAMTNVSMILWDTMTVEDRDALAHASQYAQSIGVYSWRTTAEEAEAAGIDAGITFISPDAAFIAEGDRIRDAHMASVVETLTDRGVVDAQVKVVRYEELLAKWEGLVANVQSPEELAELRYQEIWSHIDFATFGN
ncbi:MAG: C4-dicarboxylate ABC transporter substrate-binding protein [Robiginitomaculum sp.]|nr:MAG: C4-dicarboxylate ABC transporter substrate-binding protein [Robiginitomaculum sp.]